MLLQLQVELFKDYQLMKVKVQFQRIKDLIGIFLIYFSGKKNKLFGMQVMVGKIEESEKSRWYNFFYVFFW